MRQPGSGIIKKKSFEKRIDFNESFLKRYQSETNEAVKYEDKQIKVIFTVKFAT